SEGTCAYPHWPETTILLSTDLTPRIALTTLSAFAFISAVSTVPVRVARALLTFTETAAIPGSSDNFFAASSSRVPSSIVLLNDGRRRLWCIRLTGRFPHGLPVGLLIRVSVIDHIDSDADGNDCEKDNHCHHAR